MKFFSLVLIVLAMDALAAQTPAKKIPAFTFYQLDNAAFTNNSMPGGKKIFFVFFDTDCDHCQRSVARLNQHSSELRSAAVYFVTLAVREKIDRFMNKYGNSIRKEKNVLVLQDRQFQFISRFQPKKYPSMFLYSPQQTLLYYSDEEASTDKFLALIKGKTK